MLRLKSRARPITVLGVLVLCAGTSYTAEIGGQISGTLTITEDSELVDDVSCTVTGAACIVIGSATGQEDPRHAIRRGRYFCDPVAAASIQQYAVVPKTLH